MRVTPISLDEVAAATPLFAAYREFYGAPYDEDTARKFLTERLSAGESFVFLAVDGDAAVGFAQIYPSFSSVRLGRIWVLNDLFVAETARGGRAVDLILRTLVTHAREAGAIAIQLSTAHTNLRAQSVYRRHDYQIDEHFQHFELPLSTKSSETA